jgi:hypothetical protein
MEQELFQGNVRKFEETLQKERNVIKCKKIFKENKCYKMQENI